MSQHAIKRPSQARDVELLFHMSNVSKSASAFHQDLKSETSGVITLKNKENFLKKQLCWTYADGMRINEIVDNNNI